MFTAYFGLALVAGWLWVTATGRDAWPFSGYPMFSEFPATDDVNVFRLRLEDSKGSVSWWEPEVKQIARIFDQGFRASWKKSVRGDGESPSAFLERFVQTWVEEREGLAAVAVMGRSVVEKEGEWETVEQEVLRMSIRFDSGDDQ